MDTQESARKFELNEMIRFYGSLIGTTGISETNNTIANDYLNRLLVASKEGVDKMTASAVGLITT